MVEKKPKTDVRVHVHLTGEQGNIFFILGSVTGALRSNGYSDLVQEVTDAVTSSPSYAVALARISEYVELY